MQLADDEAEKRASHTLILKAPGDGDGIEFRPVFAGAGNAVGRDRRTYLSHKEKIGALGGVLPEQIGAPGAASEGFLFDGQNSPKVFEMELPDGQSGSLCSTKV